MPPAARSCAHGIRMSMVLVMEAWVVSLFGWVWLTVQDIWMPSFLASFVFYVFLLLTTWHLLVCSMMPDAHAPRTAYFNTVLALFLFCCSCIADTFRTSAFGTPPKPAANVSWACCTNCDFPRYNRALFFSDTPLYLVEAGILLGYLKVHLLMAGAQMLESSRSVWVGGAWSVAFGLLLACRFVVLFNVNTNNMIPNTVHYLLIFSQPLLSLSTLYWLFLCVFLVLLICDGIPTMGITGVRVVRSVIFGVVASFAIITVSELWDGGMLTPPLLLTLGILLFGSGICMLEAYVGQMPPPPVAGHDALSYYPYTPRRITTGGVQVHARDSVAVPVYGGGAPPTSVMQRLTREIIPVPIQMQPGKKGA